MKKLLLFGATASLTGIIIISSCKKSTDATLSNWVCHCSMTNSSGSYQADIPEQNKTEGDANAACAAVQVSYTSATTVAACQLHQQQ